MVVPTQVDSPLTINNMPRFPQPTLHEAARGIRPCFFVPTHLDVDSETVIIVIGVTGALYMLCAIVGLPILYYDTGDTLILLPTTEIPAATSHRYSRRQP